MAAILLALAAILLSTEAFLKKISKKFPVYSLQYDTVCSLFGLLTVNLLYVKMRDLF